MDISTPTVSLSLPQEIENLKKICEASPTPYNQWKLRNLEKKQQMRLKECISSPSVPGPGIGPAVSLSPNLTSIADGVSEGKTNAPVPKLHDSAQAPTMISPTIAEAVKS